MSNNRGMISLAREIALQDIAKEIAIKAKKLKDNHIKPCRTRTINGLDLVVRECTDWQRDSLSEFIGYYFISASSLRKNLKITKLNKELGI